MSFSRAARFAERKVENTPGPGHYDVKYNALNKNSRAISICQSPRFPNECRSKNCEKCQITNNQSLPCPRRKSCRSLNSSMNSSFESFSRGRLGSSFRTGRGLQKSRDLSAARRELQNLSESKSSLESNEEMVNISRKKRSNGVLLAPTCILVNDTSDSENEMAEKFSNRRSKDERPEEQSSLKDSGYHQISDGEGHSSLASSVYSEKVPSDEDLPPYSESQMVPSTYSGKSPSVLSHNSSSNDIRDIDLPDCCAFTSNGKRCEIYEKKMAAYKMKELVDMLEMHRIGMQKMYELVSEVRQSVEI